MAFVLYWCRRGSALFCPLGLNQSGDMLPTGQLPANQVVQFRFDTPGKQLTGDTLRGVALQYRVGAGPWSVPVQGPGRALAAQGSPEVVHAVAEARQHAWNGAVFSLRMAIDGQEAAWISAGPKHGAVRMYDGELESAYLVAVRNGSHPDDAIGDADCFTARSQGQLLADR